MFSSPYRSQESIPLMTSPPDPLTPLPYAPPTSSRLSVSALISFILALLSLPALILYGAGLLVGLVAVILAGISLHITRRTPNIHGRGFAIAAVILGGISFLAGTACWGFALYTLNNLH